MTGCRGLRESEEELYGTEWRVARGRGAIELLEQLTKGGDDGSSWAVV